MRRPSGPRRLSGAWGSWDEVGGKKVFRDRIRGAAMRCEGFKQDRDDRSNVPEDSLSRRGGSGVVAARAQRCWRISRIWEWNGVGGEHCCRPVLCWARNSWGPPSWAVLVRHWLVQVGGGHSIGHGSSSSCVVSQASSHASLPRPHRKKVDSTASASLPQPDRGRLAGILSTSRRRFPHPRFSVVRTCCTPSPVVQQRNELIELTELA